MNRDYNKLTQEEAVKQIQDESSETLNKARKAWQDFQDAEEAVREEVRKVNEYYAARDEIKRLQEIVDKFEKE